MPTRPVSTRPPVGGPTNEAILSLYAEGLTAGEIAAHLADVYDADVSRELISKVTDSVLAEMEAWRQRPLDRVYPAVAPVYPRKPWPDPDEQ